jgi:hypothetical protein
VLATSASGGPPPCGTLTSAVTVKNTANQRGERDGAGRGAQGVIVGVRWWVAPQAAVVEGLRARQALRRSAELVSGRWWTVAGRQLAIAVLLAVLTGVPVAIFGYAVDQPVLYVAGRAVLGTIGVSLGALFGVLLFFSLRADKSAADVATAVVLWPHDGGWRP